MTFKAGNKIVPLNDHDGFNRREVGEVGIIEEVCQVGQVGYDYIVRTVKTGSRYGINHQNVKRYNIAEKFMEEM